MRHLRRPSVNPDDEGWWPIHCDCGWHGRTPFMGRPRESIVASLEEVYRAHLPAGEERTHLLVDTREPEENRSLEEWLELSAGEEPELTEAQARAAHAAQSPVVGVFVMPIGEPVTLVADRFEDGVHNGSYRDASGVLHELPIGEVWTADGRVFRLEQ